MDRTMCTTGIHVLPMGQLYVNCGEPMDRDMTSIGTRLQPMDRTLCPMGIHLLPVGHLHQTICEPTDSHLCPVGQSHVSPWTETSVLGDTMCSHGAITHQDWSVHGQHYVFHGPSCIALGTSMREYWFAQGQWCESHGDLMTSHGTVAHGYFRAHGQSCFSHGHTCNCPWDNYM
jgi:hypothetical protein